MNILLLVQTFASTIALIVIAIVASLASRRYAVASSMAGLAILAIGLAGWWELAAGPRDLWLRYPWMVPGSTPMFSALIACLPRSSDLEWRSRAQYSGICASRPGRGCKNHV